MNLENTDPLDHLRKSWHEVPTPTFDDGDDKPQDPITSACIDWMQAGWQEIPAPPFVEPKRRSLFFSPLLRVSSALVAAALLAAITIWSFGGIMEVRNESVKSREDRRPTSENQTSVEVAESGSLTTTLREQGGLLLRKGRVKLILVQATIHSTIDKELNK